MATTLVKKNLLFSKKIVSCIFIDYLFTARAKEKGNVKV
jgi:hypothetical protein